jgi:hypothetical protein
MTVAGPKSACKVTQSLVPRDTVESHCPQARSSTRISGDVVKGWQSCNLQLVSTALFGSCSLPRAVSQSSIGEIACRPGLLSPGLPIRQTPTAEHLSGPHGKGSRPVNGIHAASRHDRLARTVNGVVRKRRVLASASIGGKLGRWRCVVQT